MPRSVCFALLFSGSLLAQPPAQYGAAIKAIETMVERERVDAGIPGIAIALVDDQTTIWSKGFGHADLKLTRPVDGDTVFRIGSVTKLFTVCAALQLVEEGKLDIDVPVTKYLPNFKPSGVGADKITLRMLMAHRSGLVREPPLGNYVDANAPSLEKTVASLNGVELAYAPGTNVKYSNAGIAVVGLVVEKVDGRPFAEAVRERVLRPLKMMSSVFEPAPATRTRLADGLMWTYHGRSFPAPTFALGIAPAAGLYSSASDLARLVSSLFAGDKGPQGSILKAATLQEMLTPQFAKGVVKKGFGLGIVVDELDGHRRVGHSGAIYGYATDFAMLPEEKLGVVVIANKDITDWATWRIANQALRQLREAKSGKALPALDVPKPISAQTARRLAGKYGDVPAHELLEANGKLLYLAPKGELWEEVWSVGDELVTHGALGSGLRFNCDGRTLTTLGPKGRAFNRVASEPKAPPELPDHFRGLIGEYGPDHFIVHVLEKDGKLHVLFAGFFDYALTEESKDVFAFPAGGLYHGTKVNFKRDVQGKATQMQGDQIVLKRRKLDGEDGRTFRIEPVMRVENLRKLAAAAQPPEERGDYRQADLVEIVALDPTIRTDLRYASDNNFLGTPLYPKTAKAYMQRPAAEALVKVNKGLAAKGYGLWVFDSYRPWLVTKMFWEATPAKFHNFVADPLKGSRHNRGCAVDLTLYDLKSGKPVAMVSGYDEFSDRAYPNYWGGTSRQRWHRDLLRHTMEDAGFSVYEAEWWHFDYKDWRSYRIGNQGFDELAK